MNFSTVCIGALICLYSIYTLIMHIKSPEKFGKLKAMKEKLGDTMGNIIHIIAYAVLPFVFGVIVIFSGLN